MTQMNADGSEERDPQTYAILGAAIEVHRELGSGFLEAVYQDALALKFQQRNVPFQCEHSIPVVYKQMQLTTPYRPDFLSFDSIIVELKAILVLNLRSSAPSAVLSV